MLAHQPVKQEFEATVLPASLVFNGHLAGYAYVRATSGKASSLRSPA